MTNSSIIGGERAPIQPPGRAAGLLGPSDSSDSGSDAAGEFSAEQLDSDSDRYGTGERSSADLRDSASGADIMPDRVDSLDEVTRHASAEESDEADEDEPGETLEELDALAADNDDPDDLGAGIEGDDDELDSRAD